MTTKSKRPRILVVDDEIAIRETLGMILKHSDSCRDCRRSTGQKSLTAQAGKSCYS
jgi:CheY-like chemotaxis protein